MTPRAIGKSMAVAAVLLMNADSSTAIPPNAMMVR
jgi:hypothetical protein